MDKVIRLKGTNTYIESLDTVYDQVVTTSTSYGSGGLRGDVAIIFPSQMIRELITEALYELLATGARYPETGIITLLYGDETYGRDLKEIIKMLGDAFHIEFIVEEKLVPNLPTLFHITFISKVDKNLIKKRDIKENDYLYYITTSEEVISVEKMRGITGQKGFESFYILKNESIDKGLRILFEDTPYFLIPEKEPPVSLKKEVPVGKGILALSPYRVGRDNEELFINKLGIIFKKGILK